MTPAERASGLRVSVLDAHAVASARLAQLRLASEAANLDRDAAECARSATAPAAGLVADPSDGVSVQVTIGSRQARASPTETLPTPLADTVAFG